MSAYSVVIPAFNAAPHIADALASVLAQTVPPERIIVIDDGSPDDTAGVVNSIDGPITYVRQNNTGPGGATTRGMMMVETEFFATIDHDDLWLPQKSELQLASLAADTAAAGVFARMAEFSLDPAAARLEAGYDGWTRATMMMRTAVARASGPMFDHPSKLGDLIDWLATIRDNGHRLIMLEDVLALRRIREGSLTAQNRGQLSRSYIFLAQRALARRRQRADSEK
jgi:glycosyltransferase involved in cell wall biosynthesis